MKSKKRTTIITVLSITVLVLILVFGTVRIAKLARRDTQAAARSVSLLYLNELAGRREQVVEDDLTEKIDVIRVAIDLMTEDDLSDKTRLEAYQRRMKKLYSLDKFAFVDTEGLIYTSTGTEDNIGDYGFDYKALSEPHISVLDREGAQRQVIIAVPVSVPFRDKTLQVCFMAIDMSEMLSGVSIGDQSSETTFCNLYTSEGVSLTDQVLGGAAAEDNRLEALSRVTFDDGSSYEQVEEDFRTGNSRQVSFTYDGVQETLSYVPVKGTDWFLTYLIRERLISGQIESVSRGIITRSIIQAALTIVVLLGLFLYIFLQSRKTAKLMLEKEKADAEHRVKQEEMEHRIALQNELLAEKE